MDIKKMEKTTYLCASRDDVNSGLVIVDLGHGGLVLLDEILHTNQISALKEIMDITLRKQKNVDAFSIMTDHKIKKRYKKF